MQTNEYEGCCLQQHLGQWHRTLAQQQYNCLLACSGNQAGSGGVDTSFEAIHWIATTYSEQTPKRYGCGSWHHVIHESRQLEIHKQSQAGRGTTGVWYRICPRETSKEQE
jgi:hypothetical protein